MGVEPPAGMRGIGVVVAFWMASACAPSALVGTKDPDRACGLDDCVSGGGDASLVVAIGAGAVLLVLPLVVHLGRAVVGARS